MLNFCKRPLNSAKVSYQPELMTLAVTKLAVSPKPLMIWQRPSPNHKTTCRMWIKTWKQLSASVLMNCSNRISKFLILSITPAAFSAACCRLKMLSHPNSVNTLLFGSPKMWWGVISIGRKPLGIPIIWWWWIAQAMAFQGRSWHWSQPLHWNRLPQHPWPALDGGCCPPRLTIWCNNCMKMFAPN